MDDPLLVIVDAANVIGSVPDGWWRDRRGAAERLRDRLARDGVPGRDEPVELVMVVEGAARGVAPVPGVRVEAAPAAATTASWNSSPQRPMTAPAWWSPPTANCGAGSASWVPR